MCYCRHNSLPHWFWFVILTAMVVAEPRKPGMCPDYMKCTSHCGSLTECHLVTCCMPAGAAPIPTCLNQAKYCGPPTIKTTKKCRKTTDCPVSSSGHTQALCCLTAGSQDGLCAEVECHALCPHLVPGQHAPSSAVSHHAPPLWTVTTASQLAP